MTDLTAYVANQTPLVIATVQFDGAYRDAAEPLLRAWHMADRTADELWGAGLETAARHLIGTRDAIKAELEALRERMAAQHELDLDLVLPVARHLAEVRS